MLPTLESILKIKSTSPSTISSLLNTTPQNLLNFTIKYYKSKYKIYLTNTIKKDDFLGLCLLIYCDKQNIKLNNDIVDYYFDILYYNRKCELEVIEEIEKDNLRLRNVVENEMESVKEAWYEMCYERL